VIALPRLEPPLNIVLVEPQIPPNTGNVARLCSVTGCRLHLVGPLGFSIADKEMRRAGLDYWFGLWKAVYGDLEEYLASVASLGAGPDAPRLHLFTARATRSLWGLRFRAGDHLVFGSEPHGLPPRLLASRPDDQVGLPMLPETRSLNLSSAVAVGVYEALRQLAPDFPGSAGLGKVPSPGQAG
jgi:tRNA (cytidine/uridine-2'-O-)-methyltransferase